MKLRPIDDRVVIEPLESEEVTKGGIVLPDSAQEKPAQGKITAIGPGRLHDNGERLLFVVKLKSANAEIYDAQFVAFRGASSTGEILRIGIDGLFQVVLRGRKIAKSIADKTTGIEQRWIRALQVN